MTTKSLCISLAALVTLGSLSTVARAQTAVQGGDPSVEAVRTEFHSPMVLNTVLAAADKTLWQPGHWFSVQEYHDLGKFTCDGVSLRRGYKAKRETWEPGLQTAVDQVDAEHVRVRFKVSVHNPEDNHDKVVSVLFEVVSGNTVLKSAAIPKIKVEEDSSDAQKDVSMILATHDLESDPRPTLRITMKAIND